MPVLRLIPNSLVTSTGWDAEGPVTVAKLSTDDGATSAVYSPTSGDFMRFLVNAAGVPAGATINSLTFGSSVLKLDPVDALTRNTVTIGGNTFESGNFSPSTQGAYQYATWTLTSNPSNGSPWTVANLSAVQVGIRKENSAGERVSFLYIDVDYTSSSTSSGKIKAQVGGSFVAKPVKAYVGGSFVTKPLKRWNGTAWVTTPY